MSDSTLRPVPPSPPCQLIWLDMEMTGLDPEEHKILEIATVITDKDLNIIHEGPELIIHQNETELSKMDAWNQSHHGKSGLTERVRSSELSTKEAEALTLEFIRPLIRPNTGILSGNSIWQDRRFIHKHMPALDQYLHYRMLDVSSIKILTQLWYEKPPFPKTEAHRALDDIKESIEELRFYRRHIFC